MKKGLMKITYIAHIRETDKQLQSVNEHLQGVKDLAESFGSKLNMKHVAGLAGMLHDLGKYTNRFQKYIYQAVFEPDNSEFKRGEVDHATAGGRLIFSMYHRIENTPQEKLLAEIVGNVIISHHGDLHDYISPKNESDFLRRIDDKVLQEYDLAVERFFQEVISKNDFNKYVALASKELHQVTDYSPQQSLFITKFIFSCLVDADRTDTRLFEEKSTEKYSQSHRPLFQTYYQKLINKLDTFKYSTTSSQSINQLRNKMSEKCETFAEKPSGIYTLSIPTGGGKTLASLRYALKHVQHYHKQRIIYIVPFTTIIEQNAKEIRTILEDDEHILEHHSNVIEDDGDDEQDDGLLVKKQKLKLARDSWDSPIIFTTLVQFLNVFYAKGNRNTRRLHNLSHAVLIFDEVQKVPTKCISLFNEALNFLKTDMHSSVLLCTATQPTLENVQHSLLKDRDSEIITDLPSITNSFKRVEIVDKTDYSFTNERLATWIKSNLNNWGSTLIILNTKAVVKDLYERLKEVGVSVYHLSTSMCAAHRKKQLNEIRRMLSNDTPFICVTTQLIEAGVDVSFKCVVRSLAGLDSIAQAAGRCNRHGETESQNVYVINHEGENLSRLKEINEGKQITKSILAMYRKDSERYDHFILSQKAMKEYFLQYYKNMESNLNYYIPEVNKEMTSLLMSHRHENEYVKYYRKKYNAQLPLYLTGSYKTAAEHFRVIDQKATSILVPYGAGKEIIAQLNSDDWTEDLSKLLKQAQQYTINVYASGLRQLIRDDALVIHLDGAIYELKENWYSQEYGLDLHGEGEMGDLIV